MRLKLNELQKLVKKTIDDEKVAVALKEEIARVLGPAVITEGKLHDVVASANDRLDVLDRTGRTGSLVWESKVTSLWINYSNPEIRKFAARVCPEKYLDQLGGDKNPSVRAAAASRMSLNSIREMIKRFPADDQLRSIFRQKKLTEAGLTKPETRPLGSDPVDGKERMGDLARTQPGPELSEAWYKSHASKFLHDYGQNIEYAWEETAVHRFCSSVKATSGVEIDEGKLLETIKKLIEEKEDRAMERDSLKETLKWLEGQEEIERLQEGVLPDLSEDVDAVRDLVQSNLAGEQYLEAAAKVFKVQESMLPLGIRKYRLGEGNARQTMVPCIGMLPGTTGFRAIDERALDIFCEHWSRRQQLAGEPLRLEWSTHPTDMNKISFSCILK